MDKAQPLHVDVIIVGGGPSGLLLAYGLQQTGISTAIIERDDKSTMMYGRACTLYPRTLEMLDQYGLLDSMTQIGFIARDAATFDHNGKRISHRGWHKMFKQFGNTFLDYVLNIRLKYSEEVFLDAYKKAGGKIWIGWELTALKQEPSSVIGTIQNCTDKSIKTFKGQYLVGADGGHSTVRHLSGMIAERMPLNGPQLKWIRLDGIVKTDMPDAHMGVAAIESPTHGNVLWCSLDHNRTRIGYCLPADKAAEFGETITEAQAIEEAEKAVQPWKIKIELVDWFTNYSIHQSLVPHYIQNRIILAGDACHTHSSGLAQGMNTGVHDAVNLAWKLSGLLKGWYKDSVLATYSTERRAAAKKLIELDQDISRLLSGEIPEKYKGWSDDVFAVADMVWEESLQFNIGLGVSYEQNILNRLPDTGNVVSGHRAPDVLLYNPGSHIPKRLLQIMVHDGAFWIIVFSGEPMLTKSQIAAFRSITDGSETLKKMQTAGMIRYITAIPGDRSLALQELDGPSFGNVYYDHDGSAHRTYGMSMDYGGIVVIRPDGILGTATRLTTGEGLEEYFSEFVTLD